MAVVTVVTTGDVRRIFACRHDAIVTAGAGPQDLRVIDCNCRNPDIRCVTIFADVAGIDMRRVFARCLDTVVAINAVAGNVYVIEIGRQPGDG